MFWHPVPSHASCSSLLGGGPDVTVRFEVPCAGRSRTPKAVLLILSDLIATWQQLESARTLLEGDVLPEASQLFWRSCEGFVLAVYRPLSFLRN